MPHPFSDFSEGCKFFETNKSVASSGGGGSEGLADLSCGEQDHPRSREKSQIRKIYKKIAVEREGKAYIIRDDSEEKAFSQVAYPPRQQEKAPPEKEPLGVELFPLQKEKACRRTERDEDG